MDEVMRQARSDDAEVFAAEAAQASRADRADSSRRRRSFDLRDADSMAANIDRLGQAMRQS